MFQPIGLGTVTLPYHMPNKPLGYFCPVLSGDGTLFDELQQRYASTFEKLNRRQKLYLLVCIASDLCCQVECDEESDLNNPEITEVINRLQKELSTQDKESLMLALVTPSKV